MNFTEFQVDFDGRQVACDWCGAPGANPLIMLHGAGKGTRERFAPLREDLMQRGVTSLALDFIGHGETGGELGSSSLLRRTMQVERTIAARKISAPLRLLGSSMGAYNAIKLAENNRASVLILLVPGIYTPECYEVPFGPCFSEIIRRDRSWEASDAWQIIAKFRGRLLIVAAEKDTVIPAEIPQRLYDAALSARSRELYLVKDAPHLLVHFLSENEAERKLVSQKIELLLQAEQ